jgi:hypothetical protein
MFLYPSFQQIFNPPLPYDKSFIFVAIANFFQLCQYLFDILDIDLPSSVEQKLNDKKMVAENRGR